MSARVTFTCPVCKQPVLAPASLEGQDIPCPKCGADVDRWPAPDAPAPAPTKPPEAAVWYYVVGDVRKGPVSESQLRALAEAGMIRHTDLVWREGMAEWAEARTILGLFSRPAKASGPSPSPPPPRPPTPPPHRDRDEDEDEPPRRRRRRREEDEDDDDDYDDDDYYGRRSRRPQGRKPTPPALIIAGYVCAVVSIAFFPPALGLAGLICGIFCIVHGSTVNGVAIVVGSSRVDLQACKLEYSIVSPK